MIYIAKEVYIKIGVRRRFAKIKKKLRSKRKLKRKVIVSTVLIYSLVLGGVKIRSSDSETAHSDNRTVVERVLDLSGGDQSKFGPGARAKFDAKANGGVRRMGQTASSSSSIFTESYTSQHYYCNYHSDGSKLSCHRAHQNNNNCPQGNQGKSLQMDKDGYCIDSRGKKFVRVDHEHKQAFCNLTKRSSIPFLKNSYFTQTMAKKNNK